MSQKKVRAALETRLNGWSTTNSIPINWEGTKSNNTAVKYVSATLIPANTTNPSYGTKHIRYRGTFRLLVRVQALDKGMAEIETISESLAQQFPRGLVLTASGLSVHIESTPSLRPSFIDGMYTIIPVDIEYRADSITI